MGRPDVVSQHDDSCTKIASSSALWACSFPTKIGHIVLDLSWCPTEAAHVVLQRFSWFSVMLILIAHVFISMMTLPTGRQAPIAILMALYLALRTTNTSNLVSCLLTTELPKRHIAKSHHYGT